MSRPGQDVFATTSEIQQAIESLTTAEAYKLRKIARALVLGTEYRDAQELINEVVARVMQAAGGKGGRQWPNCRVSFCAFVIETMKSLVDASSESVWNTRAASFDDAEAAAVGASVAAISSPSVEDELLDMEARERDRQRALRVTAEVEKYFENDEEVSLMLECLKDGIRGAQAIEACGFRDHTQYETVRRRLNRGVNKLFPQEKAK